MAGISSISITYNALNLPDHLGNNRMVLSESAAVEQVTHYYPYGLPFASSTSRDLQRFKYNGKELDTEDNLNWMDHGARMYDAALGRWNGVDALSEKNNSQSPYGYCVGNPVKFVDPDGRDGIVYNSENGEVTVKSTIVYSRSNLDEYNKKMAENYTKDILQNDINKYFNNNIFKIEIDNTEYTVGFDIDIVELQEGNIDERQLPIGQCKLTFGRNSGKSGHASGNSICIVVPQLKSESGETGATLSHEVGHTLGLTDTNDSSGRLMSYTTNRRLFNDEVLKIVSPVINSNFKTRIIGTRNKTMKQW